MPTVRANGTRAMSTIDWASTPEAWDFLKRCASRHCPHRHLKIDWDDCPCPMHTYMRTQPGLDALAAIDRRRGVYIKREWMVDNVSPKRGE